MGIMQELFNFGVDAVHSSTSAKKSKTSIIKEGRQDQKNEEEKDRKEQEEE